MFQMFLYRGTSEQIMATAAKNAVVVVDTVTGRLHVMDGKTKGGRAIAFKSEVDALDSRVAAIETKQFPGIVTYGDERNRDADKPTYGLS